MADDDRQAEIETAMMRASSALDQVVSYFDDAYRLPPAGFPLASVVRPAAEALRAALDRVRDARGDDERRTKIEAVARQGLQTILDMGCPLGREGDLLGAAQRVASETITELNLLDRVRDARGDDEAAALLEATKREAACGRELAAAHARIAELEANRSPQGEDHEADVGRIVRFLADAGCEAAAAMVEIEFGRPPSE